MPILVKLSVTTMELWTGALSCWKCHWSDLKRAGHFRPNLLLNSLKPQHSYPNSNPNPLTNQLWCIDLLTPLTPLIIPHRLLAFLESLMPLKNWCSILSFFQVWNIILLHIVLPNVQIVLLKFTSLDNQSLQECIPIPAAAVHLNLKL